MGHEVEKPGGQWGAGHSSSMDGARTISKKALAKFVLLDIFVFMHSVYFMLMSAAMLLVVVVCPAVACVPRPSCYCLPRFLAPHHVHDIIKILVLDCH